jgi:hypothetical protein
MTDMIDPNEEQPEEVRPISPDISGRSDSSELFDFEQLRLSQDFAAATGVTKMLKTVRVDKPNRQDWVRVHPDEGMRFPTPVLELKTEKETYLVTPDLWGELREELIPKILFTTMNRQGVLSLWPIRLPDQDGRIDDWNRSALEAAQVAMREWVRVTSNRSLGAYEVFQTNATLPEPEWPDVDFQTILRVAFKDRFIRDLDHVVVRRLRGSL